MPNTRWFVKRDLKQCVIHVERIQNYLTRGGKLYEPDHPKHYEMFCQVLALTEMLKEGINTLHGHL